MRDPTTNVAVKEAIAAAVQQLEGFKWYLKNPCTLDPQEVAARDKARRWFMAVIGDQQDHPHSVPAPLPNTQWMPPPGVKELILRRLMGREPAPPRKQGRHSGGEYRIRDRLIVDEIERACERGFKPTRNPRQKRDKIESACSIVCAALKRLGVHIAEGTIQGIWLKRAVRAYSPK